jgi:hypothetical protein
MANMPLPPITLKKTSIPQQFYLKSLQENASISLEKFSKIIEIFIKVPHF